MTQVLLDYRSDKESKVFEIFDKSIKPGLNVTLAYSGGKDSTALAIMLFRWARDRQLSGLSITLLHNDTLSEIDLMEKWAVKFMDDFREHMQKLGNAVDIIIATPPAIDTFYWRVLIRGYPAMSFNFRWCVNLLKMKPTRNTITNLETSLVLTGLREFESIARAKRIGNKYGGCPLGPSKCLAYYFLAKDDGRQKKVIPLRDWSTADVWEFMRKIDDFDISDLLYLYGCDEARYGCWHCTLAKVQWGLHALGNQYLYYDALRILYRRISDIPSLRMKKKGGYSRLGALNGAGRSMLLCLMQITEEKSGIPIYGLDQIRVTDSTLRELLFETESVKAMETIAQADPKLNSKRLVPISDLRNIRMHEKKVRSAVKKIEKATKFDKSRVLAKEKGSDPTKELLDALLLKL